MVLKSDSTFYSLGKFLLFLLLFKIPVSGANHVDSDLMVLGVGNSHQHFVEVSQVVLMYRLS